MAYSNDETSVKDFANFLNNDKISKELSLLIEKVNSQNNNIKKEIRYDRDQLVEISKYPLSSMTKSEFYSRLEKSNLKRDIILSLEKKRRSRNSPQESSDPAPSFNNHYFSNRDDSSKENNYGNDKSYRKNYECESVPSWRNDQNNAFNSYKYHDRNNYHRRHNRSGAKNYRNDNGYRDHYEEPEPEWFSEGPKSMHDLIDLKGFDDDKSYENSEIKDSNCSNTLSALDTSANESLSSNSFFNSNNSLLNSSSASLLESKVFNDFLLPIGDLTANSSTSRAEKWFKNKSKSETNADSNPLHLIEKQLQYPFASNDSTSNSGASILNLLQNKNLDLNKPSQTSHLANLQNLKFDPSKAVNVAELEASFNKSDNTKSSPLSPKDSSMLGKLFSLAANQESKPNSYESVTHMSNHSHNPVSQSKQFTNSEEMNNIQNIQELNKMLLSGLAKANNVPPNGYPVSAPNNFPFNFENMPKRMPGPSAPFAPIPPYHFPQNILAGPNHPPMPNFVPNLPYQAMLMNNPYPMAPPIPFHMIPNMNLMAVPNQQLRPNLPFPSETVKNEDSITEKLFKNSKFTPTSVFRKLKDHDSNKNKQSANSNKKDLNNTEYNRTTSTQLNNNIQNNGQALSNNQNSNVKETANNVNDDMLNILKQLALSNNQLQQQSKAFPQYANSQSQSHDSKSINPSDIFNVIRMNEKNETRIDLPPLPIKNALKVEDIEKF